MTRLHRLVFDIGPWARAYWVFAIAVIGFIDFGWMPRPAMAPAMNGALVYVGSAMGTAKIAFWRSLPVSARDIDRARWWQAVGASGLVLAFCLIAAGLVAALRGLPLPTVAEMALAWSGQFAAAMAFLVWQLAMAILTARGRMAGGAASLLLLALLVAGLNEATDFDAIQRILAGLASLAAAAFLYIGAGHWPAPVTDFFAAAGSRRRPSSRTPKLFCGWAAFIAQRFFYAAAAWIAIGVLIAMLQWRFGIENAVTMMAWWCLAPGFVFAMSLDAPSLRALRALPQSSLGLVSRLFAVQLGIEAAGVAIYEALDRTFGGKGLPMLFCLALPGLMFAFTLRWGQRAASFAIGAIGGMAGYALAAAGPSSSATWVLSGGEAVLLLAVAFVWSWWEVAKGHKAYRFVPMQITRWRGRG